MAAHPTPAPIPARGSGSGSLTLYTCVSDTTIAPVIKAYEKANPGDEVKLFRAPTGELNARVAGDVRSGGLRADVIWACDPLTMQDYVDQDLVGGWTPETPIPSEYRTEDYVGVALLYMVAVTGKGVPPATAWADLTKPAYDGKVALPDPAVAASALGALGYFSTDPSFGIDFYKDLKHNGATQVSTPDEVVTGVAEGTYSRGHHDGQLGVRRQVERFTHPGDLAFPGSHRDLWSGGARREDRPRGAGQAVHLVRHQPRGSGGDRRRRFLPHPSGRAGTREAGRLPRSSTRTGPSWRPRRKICSGSTRRSSVASPRVRLVGFPALVPLCSSQSPPCSW